jgi:hypothetical protein
MSLQGGQIELLNKMWELSKLLLTPEELKSMFLSKNTNEMTAWHMALTF